MNNTKRIVTLINLPQPNSLDDKLDPPLGFMYIASMLRRMGKPVRIVDLAFIDRKDWKEAVGNHDIYGMTVFSSSLYLAKEVAKIAKENNPECKVVVGGPHPTSLPEDTLKFFDCVVKGEGEFAFERELKGIVEMPRIDNLDSLPLPSRDLIDLHAYTRRVFGKRATSITTSRGCPYQCAFCCKDIFGHKVRYFSIPYVLREIESIIRNYGIKSFVFCDETFTLNKKRFHPLCAELKKLDIIYRCNGDARNNTEEDFKVLYDSGCREIAFGIESGSQKILDLINKGTTVEKNKTAIQNAKKAGLLVKAYLMIGNPGESEETINETKEFMTSADPDQFTLFQFVPLPGCAIWNDPEKYGVRIINKDFRNYYNIVGNNEGGLVIETEELSVSKIAELKKDLLEYLSSRGQRGALQDYYENIYT